MTEHIDWVAEHIMGLEPNAGFTGDELSQRLRERNFGQEYGPMFDGLTLEPWKFSANHWTMGGTTAFNGVNLEFICDHLHGWARIHNTLNNRPGSEETRCQECVHWVGREDSEGYKYWQCTVGKGRNRRTTPDGVYTSFIDATTRGCQHFVRQRLTQAGSVDPRVIIRDPEHRRQWGVLDYREEYILLGVMGLHLLVARDPRPEGPWHVLRVPPDMETVEEAHAWTFDVSVDEYRNIKEQS